MIGLAGVEASGVKPGQLCAVKSINDTTLHENSMDVTDVRKEVAVLTRLSHPHIAKFIKFMSEARHFTDDDGEDCEVMEYHLVMELAEGGSLAAVIKAKPGPEAQKVVATPSILVFVSTGSSFNRDLVSCVCRTLPAARFCSIFASAHHSQTP